MKSTQLHKLLILDNVTENVGSTIYISIVLNKTVLKHNNHHISLHKMSAHEIFLKSRRHQICIFSCSLKIHILSANFIFPILPLNLF